MPGTAVGSLVDAALLLRRHALAVLRGEPADGFVACSRSAPPEALRVMLASERCALPLRDRLARSGKSAFFPAALGVLESHATMELQRILSARRQLVELAGLARERRWPAIVLKGGVEVEPGRLLLGARDAAQSAVGTAAVLRAIGGPTLLCIATLDPR